MKFFSTLIVLTGLFVHCSSLSNGSLKAPRITEHPSDLTVIRNDPATLQCSADGSPTPVIDWYRDGDLILSGSASETSADHRSHRIMLPGGGLFFLRVVHSRRDNDAGVYWCVARNSAGSARSRNATLTVAYLHPEFRLSPQATRGILGESATLECEAPRGSPEPQIRWRKNGNYIDAPNGRVRTDDSGNLVISKLTSSDEGRYQCVAHNIAGVRETPPVLLSVHVRPAIIRPPQDVTALVGSDVSFECAASGDPAPHAMWRKQDGTLPAGRARPTESRTGLRIERVTSADSGRYICEVENAVGSTSAWAVLTVLVPPTWDWTNSNAGGGASSPLPRELRVQLGQIVVLDCAVSGVPQPFVFWNREGSPQPELLSAKDSRWTVHPNGTLVIRDIQREDAGVVWCAAVNEAGSLLARTRLEVTSVQAPPPVVIEIGPSNQTLPLKSPATMSCQAEGQPVKWRKDGAPLEVALFSGSPSSSRPRISLDDLGNLRIEDLHSSDSGSYTCIAGRDNNTAAWTGVLNVASPTNPNVVFVRSPSDHMALPGSPSQPRLQHRTPSSITISWQSSSRMGASPLLGYTVEVFSSSSPDESAESFWTWSGLSAGSERSWRIVARRLKSDTLTLNHLKPGTSHTFIVRAENSHGLSLPSPASPWFSTLPPAAHAPAQFQSSAEMEETRHRLSMPWVQLDQVKALNSTAVRLSWQLLDGDGVSDSESVVEGLYVWYRAAGERERDVNVKLVSRLDDKMLFQVATIVNPSAAAYTLTQLTPNTRYMFFLVPFYRSIEGRPSNSKTESTNEAVPSGPPVDVIVRQLNSSSALVKWAEPQPHQRNGLITGYQIYVSLDESETTLANLTLPANPTSVVIGGLLPGTVYTIRAAAWTSVGVGPPSDSISLSMESLRGSGGSDSDEDVDSDPGQDITSDVTQVVQQTWFILILGGILVAVLCLTVCAIVFRRRWAKKKALSSLQQKPESIDSDHLTLNGHVRGREVVWSRSWHSATHPKEAEAEAQAALLPQFAGAAPPQLQVDNRCGIPPPEYAELLTQSNQEGGNVSLSSFMPRRAGSVQAPSAYATTTLVSGQRSVHGSYQHTDSSCSSYPEQQNGSRSRKGSNSNVKVPNWADLLPPPPRHPPPPSPAPNDRYLMQKEQVHSLKANPQLQMSNTSSPALSKRSAPSGMLFFSNTRTNDYSKSAARTAETSGVSSGSPPSSTERGVQSSLKSLNQQGESRANEYSDLDSYYAVGRVDYPGYGTRQPSEWEDDYSEGHIASDSEDVTSSVYDNSPVYRPKQYSNRPLQV